jgi:RNA polymerase sigma factor (sigma-70 family)
MADFHTQNPTFSTTTSLIAELQSLSPQRWDAFVRVYSPLLVFWIRAEKLPTLAHDEVLQEALRTIYSGIGNFKRTEINGSFRGWLRTIVRRRVSDYHRQNAKSVPVQEYVLGQIKAPDESQEEDVSESQALRDVVARACEVVRQSVQPQTWRMFELAVLESRPANEVAQLLDVPSPNVRMAKARVMKQLRELLVDFG